MDKRAGADGTAVLRPPIREWAATPLLSAPSRSSFTSAAERFFLAFLPPALLVFLVVSRYVIGKQLGFDFRPLWEASRDVFQGVSPYPPPHAWALHDEQQFVYPPVAAVLAAPLAVFPFTVAAALLAVVEVAATGLTLRVLGVRDWRCYGLVFLWYPVIQNVLVGSITSLLALGLAVAWRYRDGRWVTPLAVAALIATKVFLWPLLLWLAATRRGFAAARALAVAVAGVTLSWALIGFAGLGSYLQLLDELSRLEQWKSYSAVAFGLVLGLSAGEARALALVGCALVVVSILLVRARKQGADADRLAFVLAIGAAFLFSPIIWTHYLALLVVPIAITRRTLTPLWFVPLAMWATPGQSNGHAWQVVLGLSVWLVVLAASLRPAWARSLVRRRVQAPAAPAVVPAET